MFTEYVRHPDTGKVFHWLPVSKQVMIDWRMTAVQMSSPMHSSKAVARFMVCVSGRSNNVDSQWLVLRVIEICGLCRTHCFTFWWSQILALHERESNNWALLKMESSSGSNWYWCNLYLFLHIYTVLLTIAQVTCWKLLHKMTVCLYKDVGNLRPF